MKVIKPYIIAVLVVVPAVLFLTAGSPSSQTKKERIERGQYLVKFGGCADCHTPKKMGPKGPEDDASLFLAGHPQDAQLPPPPSLPPGPWFAVTAGLTAWSGPWGVSYAANLTPDEGSGLGIWTEEMFLKAMQTGKHMGAGRDILPPMPWQSLAALNDEDMKSIYAYLRSIPAVKNEVPAPEAPGGKVSFE